jgi:hypothetical protein
MGAIGRRGYDEDGEHEVVVSEEPPRDQPASSVGWWSRRSRSLL